MYRMMRSVLLLATFAGLTACSPIRNEFGHPGGIVGAELDKRFFDASSSKELQLLRATMITSLASRVAVGTIRNGDDADVFIQRLSAVSRELNYLAGDLGGDTSKGNCNPVESVNCVTRATLFESNLPQMEYAVARMVIAALPQKQAAAFARSSAQGNVMGAAWKFLKLAVSALDGAHRGAAAYRSSLEILALSCTDGRDKCLGMSENGDHVINITGTKGIQDPRFHAFYDLARVSCMLLPLAQDVDNPQVASNRRTACSDLKWLPRARYDGLQLK